VIVAFIQEEYYQLRKFTTWYFLC